MPARIGSPTPTPIGSLGGCLAIGEGPINEWRGILLRQRSQSWALCFGDELIQRGSADDPFRMGVSGGLFRLVRVRTLHGEGLQTSVSQAKPLCRSYLSL